MTIGSGFSEWRRRWFGSAKDGYYTALGILRSRYADEKQHAARFVQHAQKMQYPQFRDTLLRIAADESKHADWIAEKLNKLGESLPATVTPSAVEKNSWQYLLDDLEEERRCSADLETEILCIESDYPDLAELLRRIDEEERKHRGEIREMLMRSDPQALWPA
ncbi:MAG TPA: ferritin-like domain-containing protein [Candidatus Binatia bacterium]|jgi:rubrerythrin